MLESNLLCIDIEMSFTAMDSFAKILNLFAHCVYSCLKKPHISAGLFAQVSKNKKRNKKESKIPRHNFQIFIGQ